MSVINTEATVILGLKKKYYPFCVPDASLTGYILPDKCPFFDLLSQSAELLGVKTEELKNCQTFCGHYTEGEHSTGILAGRSGTNFLPTPYCGRIYYLILAIIEKSQKPGFDSSNPISIAIDTSNDEEIQYFLQKLQNQLEINQLTRAFEAAGLCLDQATIEKLKKAEEKIGDTVLGKGRGHQCPICPKRSFDGVVY